MLNGDVAGFVSRITLLRFWLTGDQGVYFVSLIMVLYFIYPYIYSYLFGRERGNPFVRLLILLAIEFALICLCFWYPRNGIP